MSRKEEPLKEKTQAGRFREDLFYRLNVVSLVLPLLREQGDDVLLPAQHFLGRFDRKYRHHGLELFAEDVDWVRSYSWPGNMPTK